MAAIGRLCQTYTQAQVAIVTAAHAPDRDEQDRLKAHADSRHQQATVEYRAVEAMVAALVAEPANVERFQPVWVLPGGHVELHAHDRHHRPVAMRLSGEQALTVGVHLVAQAAVALDRAGAKVTDVIPPVSPEATPTRIPTSAPPAGGFAEVAAFRP